MNRFKKMRSVKLPYEKQGFIYFTCMNYEELPDTVCAIFDKVCAEVGGKYRGELRELLITDKTAQEISMNHFIGLDALYRLRKRFYLEFYAALRGENV